MGFIQSDVLMGGSNLMVMKQKVIRMYLWGGMWR